MTVDYTGQRLSFRTNDRYVMATFKNTTPTVFNLHYVKAIQLKV